MSKWLGGILICVVVAALATAVVVGVANQAPPTPTPSYDEWLATRAAELGVASPEAEATLMWGLVATATPPPTPGPATVEFRLTRDAP